MNLDSFFIMGKSHKVCEDYALSNVNHNIFGISDGCSSSRNTDFGSRILLKSFEMSIDDIISFPTETISILHEASREILNAFYGTLENNALDATLNVGYETSSGEIAVNLIGDGFIVAQYKDGRFAIYEIDYSENAPYYLTYMFDSGRDIEYKKHTQTKNFSVTTYDKLGNLISKTEIKSEARYEKLFFPKSDYTSISLFSDGLKTLIPNDSTVERIPLQEVVLQLISFPQTTGEYVKRRCNSFLKKNKDFMFYDDFSMATCFIGH